MRLSAQLTAWALRDGTGVTTDSSGGFYLPNGAMRAPDAAWVRRERLAGLTAEQRERFLPLCPDFVIELRSPSDSLPVLREKMEEYVENGARLGWLLDAPARRCYVYRPGGETEQLNEAAELSGEPELPGFSLDLDLVWRAGL
jgi:Uma2 family endonuclease